MPASPIPASVSTPQAKGKGDEALAVAFAAHKRGQLAQAEAGYREILSTDPGYVDAWHLLGGVLLQSGDFAGAEAMFRKALALREQPVFLLNLGRALQAQEKWDEGEAVLRRATELMPDSGETQHQLGVLLVQANRFAAAEPVLRRAVALDPKNHSMLNALASVLEKTDRFEEAEGFLREATALKPEFADGWFYLGLVLNRRSKLREAEEAHRRAIELGQKSAEAFHGLGIVLQRRRKWQEAETFFRRALALKPDFPSALNGLGTVLQRSGRLPEAEATFKRAIELDPDHFWAINNLAVLFNATGRRVDAEAALRRALALSPQNTDVLLNLGMLLLLTGRFKEGWPYYEARYQPGRHDGSLPVPTLPFPAWKGEPLAGKSMLVWSEQGFGDTLQVARYVPLLRKLGVTRITWACRQPLQELMRAVAGIDAVIDPKDAVAAHDYWSFAMSLPMHLGADGTNIRHELPYLHSSKERRAQWQPRLPATGLRVGLVWKGSAEHANDANRSLPGLDLLAPLWSVPGISFISLQKGAGEDEALAPSTRQPLAALGHEVRDFGDSAAIIDGLDLVISVDTATVHLAGALGKRVWVMLPARGLDWRWQLERSDSPWYPGVMRLFRQQEAGDWAAVVEEVRQALASLAAQKPVAIAPPADPQEKALRKAIAKDPADARLHNNLGALLASRGRLPEAEASYLEAAKLDAGLAEVHANLGNVLKSTGRLQEAEASYRRAIECRPGFTAAINCLANLLREMRRREDAHEWYGRAIQIDPQSSESWNNLGLLLQDESRLGESLRAYARAIELQPGSAEAHNNLGALLRFMGRHAESEEALRKAVALRPDFDAAKYNLACTLLAQGHYKEGWQAYEARMSRNLPAPIVQVPPLRYPQWMGEPLEGKSIVVWTEQGFGDALQFARYAPLLKARGAARVSIACRTPLQGVLSTLDGVDTVYAENERLVPHDYWVLALSLPHRFGTLVTKVPAALPYLQAEPARIEKWRAKLPRAGFKVGLVWKGAAGHQNDANRSLPSLGSLAPLWSVPRTSFVSLQKGPGENEAMQADPARRIVALGHEMADFADSAAVIAQLDLVICVDTATAHLAGALGKPVWVLLPSLGVDWRWMSGRMNSPWYPGVMRLFTATQRGGWTALVDEVRAALTEVAGGEHAAPPAAPFNIRGPLPKQAPLAAVESVVAATAPAAAVPREAARHFQLGLAARRDGRGDEAETHFRAAIELAPAVPRHHGNLGVVLREAGRAHEAEAAYRKALELDPHYAEGHANLANLLKHGGRIAEAETSYRKAIELKPDLLAARNGLGVLLMTNDRAPEAEAVFRQILEDAPDSADTWNNLGTLLQEAKRPQESEAAYTRALALKPDLTNASNNLGVLLQRAGRVDEARTVYARARKERPDDPRIMNNEAALLAGAMKWDEAEAAYRRALELKPDYPDAHNNLGGLLQITNRPVDAEAHLREAIALRPEFAEARLNLGTLLLSQARFGEAWPFYEARHSPALKEPTVRAPKLAMPPWQGEPLPGKSIVIWPEQGYGDSIQFARYAALLKAAGATRVTMVCREPLRAVLETVEAIDQVVVDLRTLKSHDYWCFALSLPARFATTLPTIPATLPYIHADAERIAKWKPRLPEAKLKIGVVWKGSAGHKNDGNRSLPSLEALAPLWTLPDSAFVSLQKGQGEEEAMNPPAGQPITALGHEIGDFADAAAVVAQLDIIVSVDTALAHLAGALGRPTGLLLPALGTDWRWMQERVDSPWYPGVMRLFRQTAPGDWATPVQETLDSIASMRARSKPLKRGGKRTQE